MPESMTAAPLADSYDKMASGVLKQLLPTAVQPSTRTLWLLSEAAGLAEVRMQYRRLLQQLDGEAPSMPSPDHVREPSDPQAAQDASSLTRAHDRMRRDMSLAAARIGALEQLGASTNGSRNAPAMSTRAGIGGGMCALFPRCLSILGGTSLQPWVMTALKEHAAHAVPAAAQCSLTGHPLQALTGASVAAGGSTPATPASGSGAAPLTALTGTGDWGLDGLLSLRRWCTSSLPRAWLDYAKSSLGRQAAGKSASASASASASSPAPPAGSSSLLEVEATPGVTTASSPDEVVRTVAKIVHNEVHAHAAGTASPGTTHVVIHMPEGGGGAASSPPPAGHPSSVLSSDDVQSLLTRLEGTLSCLCLNAGVPAAGLGAGDSSAANLTAALPALRSFASMAGHTLRLPPASDAQVAAWVHKRLIESGGENAAEVSRLKDMYAALLKAAKDGSLDGLLSQFLSELQQLRAERERLEEVLKRRVAELIAHLKRQIKALRGAVKASADALLAAENNRKATVNSARSHRQADLALIGTVRRLLREMEQVKPTSDNVRGCEGGGGNTGAKLAAAQAKAQLALAKAQAEVEKSDVAMQAGKESRATAKGLHAKLQDEVVLAHLQALAASVAYEAATQRCIAIRNGENADFAASEEAAAWKAAKPDPILGSGSGSGSGSDTSMSPLALVAAGKLKAAVAAATSAESRLVAARNQLEEERRLWEEAVVRLARPKTCLQLLSLATDGSDGVYTVFPPDDVSYKGVTVYCDMTTDGGGWTLVGYGQGGVLGSPLGVTHGVFQAEGQRKGSANVNALWVVQASTEVAYSWVTSNDAPPPSGNLSSYDAAVSFSVPAPSVTTLSVLPPPPPQPCTSSTGDWSAVRTRCIVGKCDLPDVMYTATDSLAVCDGHAYGLVVPPDAGSECATHFEVDGASDSANGAATTGVMVGVDGTPGCMGVLSKSAKDGVLQPKHMAVWMR